MAFWCSEQIVVILEGPDGKSEVVLPQPFARIGSHPQSDIVLAEPLAPRRALYLHATPEGLYCVDLDVPEASLEKHERWLEPDETVTIGPYRLTARLASGGSDAPPSYRLTERGSASNPLPVVNIYCGSLLKDRRRLRARLSLVGRRPQCSIRLRGYQVSSYHCVLYWHERRLWCIDLFASNGTQLNEQPIGCHEVQLGDRLDVGEFRLVYHRWSPRNWHEGVQRHDTWVAPTEEENRPISPGGDFDAPPGAATIFLPAGAPMPAGGWHQAAPVALPPPVAPIPNPFAEAHAEALAAGRAAEARLSAEVERLQQERAELQARWEQSSRELAARIQELEERSSQTAAEHASLRQDRDQLQAERTAMAQQLADRERQLDQLRADLAQATAPLGQQEQRVPDQPQSLADFADEPQPAATPGEPEWFSLEQTGEASQASGHSLDLPFVEAAQDDSITGTPLDLREAATGPEPAATATDRVERGAAAPLAESSVMPAIVTHSSENGRRTKRRDELGSFVSDRLVEIEERKRRRKILIWSGALLAAVGASAVGVLLAWQLLT